jgi:hypothetical protein
MPAVTMTLKRRDLCDRHQSEAWRFKFSPTLESTLRGGPGGGWHAWGGTAARNKGVKSRSVCHGGSAQS